MKRQFGVVDCPRHLVAVVLMSTTLATIAVCALASSALAAPASSMSKSQDPYANPKFNATLSAGLAAFYLRDFEKARQRFAAAVAQAPVDALALAFENATMMQLDPGAISDLAAREEDVVAKRPRDAVAQTRLAFTYLFMAENDPARDADAREALDAALAADARLSAAHVGMGIYRYNHSAQSRAKAEFLAALAISPHDALAREYLASIYQEYL